MQSLSFGNHGQCCFHWHTMSVSIQFLVRQAQIMVNCTKHYPRSRVVWNNHDGGFLAEILPSCIPTLALIGLLNYGESRPSYSLLGSKELAYIFTWTGAELGMKFTRMKYRRRISKRLQRLPTSALLHHLATSASCHIFYFNLVC